MDSRLPSSLLRGICHDLRNHLTVIQGNAELASQEPKSHESREHCLSSILKATREAHFLCNLLSTVTSDNNHLDDSYPWDITPILEEAWQLVYPSYQFSCLPPSDTLVIVANRSRIFLALKLCFRFAAQLSEDTSTLPFLSLDYNADHILLSLSFSLPARLDLSNLDPFDPEETHPILGASLALYLTTLKSIVGDHHGSVHLDIHNRTEARLLLTLPRSNKSPLPAPKQHLSSTAVSQSKPSRKRRVLLVDDEEFMRHLGVDVLQSLRCRVSVAASADEALELIQKDPDYFDVIISDSRMPGMTGEELARAVCELRPGLPFLLVTAFSAIERQETLAENGINAVINKPFLIEDLKNALNTHAPLPNHD